MELRQLEYFLAVVEEGSFTSAAARLYMGQSSLSASLLGLERELGTELFTRGRRGAELTDAGRALLEPARAALADAERARDAVAAVKGLLRGSVRVATVAVPRRVDVVETIRQFQEHYPGVQVYVLHDGAKDLVRLVAEGQVDLAVTPLTHQASPALRFEPMLSTPLAVACPAGHRLSGAHDVDVSDLLGEPIIDLPPGWWVRDLFDRMLAERDLRREVRLEVNEWYGLLTMVQRGLGISYGPRACLDDAVIDDVGTATLADAPPWELGVVTKDEMLRGAAGRAFLDTYRQQYRAPATVQPSG
jgi:DNA-binding transcriptional LysR family regulator